eukprot:Unigene12337_Nuclearia_a/m.37496 Unigene12337_Nuclearia_a/g.37496  ORF Unigene12337_Nuclearia_a/g.37496 Unigene12337_Nuclearia_a/m.37496 type:complete len:554 (-) Unigene12337_Nuclearia_a:9-1670(-)
MATRSMPEVPQGISEASNRGRRTDRVVDLDVLRHAQLRADAVRARHEDRVLVARRLDVKQAAKAAERRVAADARSRLGQRLNALDKRVARGHVHAGVGVRDLGALVLLARERAMRDVAAEEDALERHVADAHVRLLHRRLQSRAKAGHRQHTAARRQQRGLVCAAHQRLGQGCAGDVDVARGGRHCPQLDRRALGVAARVAGRSGDDRRRKAVAEAHVDRVQAALAARKHDLRQVTVVVDERHQHLRLGVAEAAVVLEHLGPAVGRDHQTRVEDADVGRALAPDAVDRRLQHGLHHVRHERGRAQRRRGVRAHSARVRALVAVERALVVLRRRHRHDGIAVAECQHRQLLALDKLLDHDLVARDAERAVAHDRLHGRDGLLGRHGHEHALAGREARCLDHEPVPRLLHVRERRGELAEDLVVGGRDAVAAHKVLRERLGALELRAALARAEASNAGGLERVGDAVDERLLRADGDKIDAVGACKVDELRHARGVDRGVGDLGAEQGRATVAGRDKDVHDGRPRGQLARERVLAAAAADEQHRERRGGLRGHGV